MCNVIHFASLADHCGVNLNVTLHLQLQSPLPTKDGVNSYWKLNTAILLDENFLPCFKGFWKEISNDISSYPDVADWWDSLAKPKIKNFCISFSINRKEQRTQTKLFLLSYLRIALGNKEWEEVARIKEKLNQMLMEDAMGFVVRSRFHQNAEEERASLFHAGREMKNGKNSITKIKSVGKILTDQSSIEKVVTRFFGALFNGHHSTNLQDTGQPFTPNNTYLDEVLANLVSMDGNDSRQLEVDLNIDEVEFVVHNCASNKAPGLDGLSYEFYKCVWPTIKETFHSVLQCWNLANKY